MSFVASGPVLPVIWEGDVAGGEPEVVMGVGERSWRREMMLARTGTVSIESGERPEGRETAERGWGVD